ncbi:MAG: hypothetical protein V4596_00720 [Bdellovibrionota bacterium]
MEFRHKKTVLYDLADDGTCKAKFKLNFMVGKMDFDYQNKYAAFHASSDSAGKINEVSGVAAEQLKSFDDKGKLISTNLNQQIFVMDLKSKKIHKLSFGSDNIYYPHFGENGLLYALKLDNLTKKYSVLEINVEEALKIAEAEGSVCVDCNEKKQESLFKIGCGH